MWKKFKELSPYILITLFALIISGGFAGKDIIIDKFTKVVHDTTYIQQDPDTIYTPKDSLIVKYKTRVDSSWKDSLETTIAFYESLIDSIKNGVIPTIHDSIEFDTGDKLAVDIGFLPFGIEYFFYPAPERYITITITNTEIIDKTPNIWLHLGGGLFYSSLVKNAIDNSYSVSNSEFALSVGLTLPKSNVSVFYNHGILGRNKLLFGTYTFSSNKLIPRIF